MSVGVVGSPGTSRGIAVANNLAIIADDTAGIQIIDISNTYAPTLLGNYNTPGAAYDVVIKNNLIYVADRTAGLQIIDISNPSTPALLGSYNTPGSAYGIAIQSNVAFIADGSTGLQIIDISDPTTPTLIGNYNTPGSAESVVIEDHTAYIADGNAGLHLIDITDPNAPTPLGSYDTPGYAYDVAITNKVAYVADWEFDDLQIIDISDPTLPTLYAALKTNNAADGIAVAGNTIFVADYDAGLAIYDASNPSAPKILTSLDTVGFAEDVTIASNTAFVADRSGLQIFDFLNRWTLSGTPSRADVGNYEIKITATDDLGGNVYESFLLRVEGPPQRNENIPEQIAKVGRDFHYFMPQGMITDPNNDPIAFSANQWDSLLSDYVPLPPWLQFNGVSASFSGRPRTLDTGHYNITIHATDHIQDMPSLAVPFLLDVSYPPVLNQPIPTQITRINLPYQLLIPSDTFIDQDFNPLSYFVTGTSDTPLPNWLNYSTSTRTLSGIPLTPQETEISITAIEPDGGRTSTTVALIVVNNLPPELIRGLPTQYAQVKQEYRLDLADNHFVDPEGDTITYTTARNDGGDLPAWLTFDSQTGVFTGTPANIDTKAWRDAVYSIDVVASDHLGATTGLNFDLHVTGTSMTEKLIKIGGSTVPLIALFAAAYKKRSLLLNRYKPQRYQKIADTIMIGQPYSRKLETPISKVGTVRARCPSNTTLKPLRCCSRLFFNTRTYPGGALLPRWLHYNPACNTLSIRTGAQPTLQDQGDLIIEVRDRNDIIQEQFLVRVTEELEQLATYVSDDETADQFEQADAISVGKMPDETAIELDLVTLGV